MQHQGNEMLNQPMYSSEISVSVIIPCFNQGEFILDAISSVEISSGVKWETIIINDGSTDPLTAEILTYLKQRDYWVIDQENQGLAQARNTGIKSAQGRFILPLDADNKVRADYLSKAVEILDKVPDIGIVYADAELFGEQQGIWRMPDFNGQQLLLGNYIDACAVFRKVVWENCGGYDPYIPEQLGFEDWDLWLGAAEQGWGFYHIGDVMFDYRVRRESMVSACRIPENRQKLFEYICGKHFSLYTRNGNYARAIAQKELALSYERAYTTQLRSQLQQTQAELTRLQSQLQQAQAELTQLRQQI